VSGFVPWNSRPLEAWAERYAEGRTVDLGGRRTHYVERGTGQPVVLVHGFNLDSSTWISNLDPLAARFRVIAPDLWGQGYSTRGPLEWGYPLFCEQILTLLDALGIERASLVGHSMGGGTAALFARHHPERVAKLVLVDAAGIPAPSSSGCRGSPVSCSGCRPTAFAAATYSTTGSTIRLC
jgi:pimeloyl-ACP methyl ester carboxylesterase